MIGRVFWRGPVRELLDGEAPDFAVLESRDFIRRRSGSTLTGEREFAFKHALTREVAYASLPVARRARLHAGFADWLERTLGGRDEDAPFLAHHYAEAVRPDEADLAWEGKAEELARVRAGAVVWLRRAAELATTRYELDEAIALLERALPLEDTDEGRSELWGMIGRATALKFDGPAFFTAMQHAIALTQDDTRRGELAAELALESFMRSGMYADLPALERMDTWIATALALAPAGSPARAKALVAKSFSDIANGGEAAAEASAIAEEVGDPGLIAVAWDAEHAVALDAGRYEEAREWSRRRLELFDAVPDPDVRADILQTPIRSAIATGHFDEARELALRTDEVTRPLTRTTACTASRWSSRWKSCWAAGTRSCPSKGASARPWPRTKARRARATLARCCSSALRARTSERPTGPAPWSGRRTSSACATGTWSTRCSFASRSSAGSASSPRS